ncbi:hypothetical protein [Bosea sp. TND4EK4]|uniref:hypothetical protein n=1 Tax=Bosea sp. TND4EK4 TaxID=1907408 RepID=UPI0011154A3E|nr:hypothetical protein [Bosea sp. TND4EK4]
MPEEATTDFHLSIGRQIARLRTEMARVEAEEQSLRERESPGDAYMTRAAEHLYDRDDTLIGALAAFPAQSLAGATVQLAAAMKLHSVSEIFTDRRPEDDRAISRLLGSAIRVMVDAAGLDPARDGIADLAELYRCCWRNPFETVAELFPEGRSVGETEAVDR